LSLKEAEETRAPCEAVALGIEASEMLRLQCGRGSGHGKRKTFKKVEREEEGPEKAAQKGVKRSVYPMKGT
jgi:hypothetical protein